MPKQTEHQQTEKSKPLVYSCSGCSNVAQLANDVAVWLDREGAAQMSCIAGVGGKVKSIVRTAQSGRKIIALDGCPLACVKKTLETVNVEPTWHIELTRMGLKKEEHKSVSLSDTYRALNWVSGQLGLETDNDDPAICHIRDSQDSDEA